jgi:hypothetical protein
LPAAISKKIQRWIVSCRGNSNLRVGRRHLALGFRDVWPPLEQVRRQSRVERRRPVVEFLALEMKLWRRFPGQHGNRIFKLFSLLPQQDGLRPRGIQKGFFLCNVQAGGHPALVA